MPPSGRVGMHEDRWQELTADEEVLQFVKGWCLKLSGTPIQHCLPRDRSMPSEKRQLVSNEITQLLKKGALLQVPVGTPGFLSPLFVVPKKNGKLRPVVDLRELNGYVVEEHFKMESINTLRDLLQVGDHFLKVDLTDAYLSMPVHPHLQPLFSVLWENRQYQFQAVPFGLSSAPRQFTKLLHPIISCLRQQGARMVVYLDDILLMGKSRSEVLQHGANLMHLLVSLGFQVNMLKSILTPTHTVEFLGFMVNSERMTLQLPEEKVAKALSFCQKLRSSDQVTVRQIASLLGVLTAASPAVLPVRLHTSSLEQLRVNALQRGQEWTSRIHLPPEAKAEIDWWLVHLGTVNGRPLPVPLPELIIQTDASSSVGWGAVCGQQHAHGQWTAQERSLHINCLELRAAFFGLRCFASNLSSVHIVIQLDNQSAMYAINKMASNTSQNLNWEAQQLWHWCMRRKITVRAEYLPGALNTEADFWSRLRETTEWTLHRDVFLEVCHQIPTTLEVDLFASRTTTQLPAYVSWHPDPYAFAVDAFSIPWTNLNGYAFPPFCLISRCLRKIIREEVHFILLIAPMWRGAHWFPLLLDLCIDYPLMLPQHPQLLLGSEGQRHPLLQSRQLRLVAWRLSGKPGLAYQFRRQCPESWRLHADSPPTAITTLLGQSGLAGVCNGSLIPFLHLV